MLYLVPARIVGGRVGHIGRGRYCLFLAKGFARTVRWRMSVDNIHAFNFVYTQLTPILTF